MNCKLKSSIKRFIKERDEVLFSYDRGRIVKWLSKNGEPIPQNEDALWGGVCKAICSIPYAPENIVKEAQTWLDEHHMSPKVVYSTGYRNRLGG